MRISGCGSDVCSSYLLRIRLQDRPGALFKVMKLFDEKQVNIIEIYHQRIFTTLPAKGLITAIECEARDREHLDSLVASLRDAGYMVQPVALARSEERRVGKECVSTCDSRWWPY